MPTTGTYKVNASKEFTVPASTLFDAWTQPDQLKQWWKPMNNTLTEVTNDLKEGGTVRYVFGEANLQISGEYQEVKEKERLVYSWNWAFSNDAVKNASYMLTVEFKDNGSGSGSSIQVTQDNLTTEEGTQAHQQGWDSGLEDLATYLNGSGKEDAPTPPGTTTGEATTGGYNEAPEQAKVGGG